MKRIIKNKGFLQFIVIIIIAICLLAYFNINIHQAINWFIEAVKKVFS